ncbi:MAG: DNA polymerase III subunit beta [Verrucomicrobia bacterium]|nr:MAG: DNA polymerase III subunit beta [Verrucomicrobiota bacterium]
MKLKLARGPAVTALQKIQAIISPRTTLPVLNNVLLETADGSLKITATDLDVTVTARVEADVVRAGATTVPAKHIINILRALPGEELQLEVDTKNNATIRSGSSYFRIIGIPKDDFPPAPDIEEKKSFTLEQSTFRRLLELTSYAAAPSEEGRAILMGVLLSFKGEKLTVVATDGRRLALHETEMEIPRGSEVDMVVPIKTVQELQKTLGEEGDMVIRAGQNQVAFEFGDTLVVSKLLEGTYPNYRQVIPAASDKRVVLEREMFLDALRRAAIVASSQAPSVKLDFARNRLEISAENRDIGEARESMAVKYGGEDVTIAFNPQFLIEPLSALDTDEVILELTDELSPGVIKTTEAFLYVLMPVRLA